MTPYPDPPIVIGGCARSGTTLLLSVLSCHPEVNALADETRALSVAPVRMQRLERALRLHPPLPRHRRWAEKTSKNVTGFGLILDVLPEARLIHIVRDGRDVVTSRHPIQGRRAYYLPAERWIADVSAGLRYMDHPSVLTVRYEDLVLDYERTVATICEHTGLSMHPNFGDYPTTATIVRHQSWATQPGESSAVARQIGSEVIGRWRLPEHKAQVQTLTRKKAGRELLARLGYQ